MNLDNKKPGRKPLYVYYIIAAVIIILLNVLLLPAIEGRKVQTTDYSTFLTGVEKDYVKTVEIQDDYIYYVAESDGQEGYFRTVKMNDPDLVDRLHDANVKFGAAAPQQTSIWISLIAGYVLPIAIFILLGRWLSKKMMSSMGGGPGGAMSFGKSNAKVYVKSSTGIKFSDVAGEDEAKDLLTEIVDYLHNPQKYREIGASMPKGALLVGPPGTGKTLLAIEEVKKSVARGEKVALFCFNSNLADWLNSYFSDMPESVRPEFVGTLHKYMTQVAKEADLLPPYPHDPERIQYYYQTDLPEAAAYALLETGELFDKIVVDEAQDLIRDSYLDVMGGCLKKGLSRGRWTLFGDFSMQAIYAERVSGTKLIEKLDNITSFIRFKLTVNCRNTKPICKEIETVTGFKAPHDLWTKVDGPPVQYLTWSTMESQCKKLKAVLKQLADSHIEPEKITILSPRKREDSVVSMLDGYVVKDFSVPPGMNTTFCTIQAYKGLENSVIILADIEGFSAEKLMYVGLSRACTGLYVLESDSAKREYDNLLMRRLFNE